MPGGACVCDEFGVLLWRGFGGTLFNRQKRKHESSRLAVKGMVTTRTPEEEDRITLAL